MKTLAVVLLLMTTGVIADEPPDDAVVMSAAEHRALVHKFIEMNTQIDDLERKLREAKDGTGCA